MCSDAAGAQLPRAGSGPYDGWMRAMALHRFGVSGIFGLRRVAAMLSLLAALPAAAQDARESTDEAFQHCVGGSGEPVVLLASCSAAIKSGQLTQEGLALALVVRGSASGPSPRPDLAAPGLDPA